MKKIKYLLFWIVSLFWIGFSFWYNYNINNVEYFSINNYYSNYLFSASSTFNFRSLNWWSFSSSISSFYRKNSVSTDDSILDISTYFLTGSKSLNYVSPYLFVNNSSVSLLFKSDNASHSSNWSYLFKLSTWVNSYSSLLYQNSSNFIRILWWDDCILIDDIFNDPVWCLSSRSFIFSYDRVLDSSRWSVFDTTVDWISYIRWAISPSIYDEYSFAYSFDYTTSWLIYVADQNSIPFLFSTVFPTISWNYLRYDWIFAIKLDNLYKKTNNTVWQDLLVIALTWDDSDLDFIYSLYSCPDSSYSMFGCSFLEGGFLRPSGLSNSFNSFDWSLFSLTWDQSNSTNTYLLLKNFLYFLWLRAGFDSSSRVYSSPIIYTVRSNKIIQFYRPAFNNAWKQDLSNYSLSLLSSGWINILDLIGFPWWNWNQYTWTWNITLSGCVDTQVCTYVTWNNWVLNKICHTSCVSQEVINSWGYISYDWSYYFVNTPLSLDDLKKSDLTYTTWYLDSWGILNPVYFEDLFDPNKKAVWVCPFPYYSWPLDFLSNIWTDWVYLFMPLICFYSAFQHWAHLSYFDNSDIISWGVLTSPLFDWNSENHRIFFMFLDVLLSIGLLWLFHHLSSLL